MNQDSAAFLRAIKGPVMMITIGVLFALDNLTPFSFHRTWPVLLVVAGILSLGKSPARVRGKFQYQPQWGPPRPPASAPVPPPPVSAAPPSTFVLLDGTRQTTADLKGKVTLVNFWATSCVTCVAEMPKVIATYDKYKALQEGANADYIPALAKVDPKLFGIALVTPDGKVYTAGDVKSEVSI